MKTKSLFVVALLAWFAVLTVDASAVVLRVVVVETEDVDAYVKQISRGQALLKSIDSPAVIRVWQARFAGDQTGRVVASIEYPDMAALGADYKKMKENSEFASWLKDLKKVRRVVSDSIYEELTSK